MAELLLELFSEEIPARMQARAAADLKRLVADGLKAAGLSFNHAEAYVTPRRLALVVDGLPQAQPDVSEERRGPRVDAPEKAVQGFLRANGLTLEECERRETDKGAFWYAVIERKGRPTAEVLVELLQGAIAGLPWPKSMRWGSGSARWVRPLHAILCLFNGAVVPVRYAGLEAGRATFGHRFHAPDPIEVLDFEDYRAKLEEARVVLDPALRRARILSDTERLLAPLELTLVEDDGLLDELTGLVEWPVPLLGRIDEAYMSLPQEVLVTAMRAHQRYMSLLDRDGALAPRFVVVANLEAEDGGRQIVAGNERVLKARLADARFFWDEDRKLPLADRLPALEGVVFHARLGSLADKVRRIEALAGELAQYMPDADPELCRRAARLAKADLVTGMVGEFPELQGVMGRYYARNDGEPAPVSEAIAEHYAPQGPNDRCPTAPVSVAVALADKIDTLVGFFAIDEKPTGSKDPFALRRAALGVIRLIVENGIRMGLLPVFGAAMATHRIPNADRGAVAGNLLDFLADRLKVHLRGRGVRHDLIAAVFALGGEDDLVRLLARVGALEDFLGTEDGANLLVAYRRAANILRIEEKKDGRSHAGAPDPARFREPAEEALLSQLQASRERAEQALRRGDFAGAMRAMADLRGPVDRFFDKVTVNADDPQLRENRLKLLSQIRDTLHTVADFGQIEGG